MQLIHTVMAARYLTKSRFKLALDCPTRLYYAGRPDTYDNAAGNSFLAALAEGGYQVGALACAMFPDGVEVDDIGHDAQVARTQELLQQEDVTIFEAALAAQGLFVRVDILRKRGRQIELIEVKAKSYDRVHDGAFRNARGRLQNGWLPYIRDIAFQAHVAVLAFPQFEFRSSLMLADKSGKATVDGLNQRFRVRRDHGRLRVEVQSGTDPAALGAPVLALIPVDDAVAEIQGGTLQLGALELPFADAVRHLAAAHQASSRLAPAPGAQCAGCQFKAPSAPAAGDLRSGFHECWSETFGWIDADFTGGTVLDIWNLRRKAELLTLGVRKPTQVTLADLGHDGEAPGIEGMTPRHRQWYQCHGGWPDGGPFYFDHAGLAEAMRTWRYPLHFIDFETCAVAIPFASGQRPYETVAFQFSHHVMHEDGRVEHRSQFLEATPGVDSTLPFLRALRSALSNDVGTVFRWATHENTVLNQLRQRLLEDAAPPSDIADLLTFIEQITTRRIEGGVAAGPRNMIDLCKLAERHFFHPDTRGSSSLKKVLPALMRSSAFLQKTYRRPVYGSADMPSLNLRQPMCWWAESDGHVADPYDLLPPVFDDIPDDEVRALTSGLPPDLQDGGAAMTAYARLQFEALDQQQRTAIESALLRYCELDTLAMVMAVQAWMAWASERHAAASTRLAAIA
jgi:hypothetical protein